jgi:hypothetical protein
MVIISCIVMMNFTIALINDCYADCIPKRIEQAYQKKCGILCELHKVFGRFAPKHPNNILVTRKGQEESKPEETNEALKKLKKTLWNDQIEINQLIHQTHKELLQSSEEILALIKRIKQKLM